MVGTALHFLMPALGGAIGGLYNAQQAQANRDWQEKMSNTAHQREVADMRKAGLNPILSATGGVGAPVGTGSTASMPPPDFTNAYQAKTQKDLSKADLALKNEQSMTENLRRTNMWAEREKMYQDMENSIKLTNAQVDNLNKTGIASLISSGASGTNAKAAMINANVNTNQLDIDKTQQADYNAWAKKHPYLKSVDQTLTRYMGGATAGAQGASKINLKKPRKVGF